MKFLKKFNTNASYKAFVSSGQMDKPNVSLISESNTVKYRKLVLPGVYIQHISGRLYLTQEWLDSGFVNSEANGVAVVTNNCKLVIAKTQTQRSGSWSSNTDNVIEGAVLTTSINTAATDYAGASNTAFISDSDTNGVAFYCNSYTFPNGAKGYLPAAGELMDIFSYSEDVNNAMSIIGGGLLVNGDYWSSTQYSATEAWTYFPGLRRLDITLKSQSLVNFIVCTELDV